MKQVLTLAVAAVILAACAGPREMPDNGTGTDEMKPSPCACMPVPFDSRGFRWVG